MARFWRQLGGWAVLVGVAAFMPASVRAQEQPSFEALWTRALTYSPALAGIRAERSRAEAAEAHARGVLAENPTFGFGGGPRYQGAGRNYDLSVSLRQPVRVAGERRAERELVSKVRARVDAEIDAATWALRQELKAAYRRALVARARVSVEQATLAFAERVWALTQKKVRAGELSPLKARFAEIAVVEARARALEAEQALLEQRLVLARVAGVDARDPPVPEGELALVELPPLAELVEAGRKKNPRLTVRVAQRDEARARVQAADKRGAPVPEVGVAYEREGSTPAAGPVSRSVLATFSLKLPLFFRNQPERAEARADNAIVSQARLRDTALFEAEVARLRSRVDNGEKRLELYVEGVLPKFAEQLAALEKALALGEIDVFELEVLRTRILQAELTALDLWRQYEDDLTDLEWTLGYELPQRKTFRVTP